MSNVTQLLEAAERGEHDAAEGTTYHFQLVAGNTVGTNAGADLTFTTGAGTPMATTTAASSISSSSVTLNGTVKPNGATTVAYFRYGLTTNYGSYGATNRRPHHARRHQCHPRQRYSQRNGQS